MKLQTKVALILASVWAILSIIMFVDSRYVVAKNYQQLENNLVNDNIHDVRHAYSNMLSTLALYTLSWAQWDEAYEYMQKKESNRFVQSSFVPGTFTGSKINFFLLYDKSGKFYDGRFFDLEKNKFAPIPTGLFAYLQLNKPFLTHKSITSNKVGTLKTPEGIVIMSSLPITTSNGKGPLQGTLLMGYYLNKSHIQNLSAAVDNILNFYPLPLTTKNISVKKAYTHLSNNEKQFVVPADSEMMNGFIFLNDIDNKPVGILEIKIPREVYTEGMDTIYHYLAIVAIIGVTLLVLMWYLLKIFVLNRVISVSNQVINLNHENNFSKPINLSGEDELGSMVDSINHMMQLISFSQKELHFIAHHDGLTMLPNRNYFYSLLEKAILDAKKMSSHIAIMFLDMDKFKEVNDTYGHAVGDKLLIMIAKRLKAATRKTDVVGRLAGDEFIIFSRDITETNSIDSIIKRILEQMAHPFEIGNISIHATFSVGISVYPQHGQTIEELTKHADQAMYHAKEQPGNSFCFYIKEKTLY